MNKLQFLSTLLRLRLQNSFESYILHGKKDRKFLILPKKFQAKIY